MDTNNLARNVYDNQQLIQRILRHRFAPNCSKDTMKDNTYLFGDNINLHQSKTNPRSSMSTSRTKTFYLQSFNQSKHLLPSTLTCLLLIPLLVTCFFILTIMLARLTRTRSDYSNIMKIWMNIKLHGIILYNSTLSSISSQQVFPFDRLNRFLIHSKLILISQKLIALMIRRF